MVVAGGRGGASPAPAAGFLLRHGGLLRMRRRSGFGFGGLGLGGRSLACAVGVAVLGESGLGSLAPWACFCLDFVCLANLPFVGRACSIHFILFVLGPKFLYISGPPWFLFLEELEFDSLSVTPSIS